MMDTPYDVAVIGGGVVGCAVLFELTRRGYTCILLEKNHQIMSEASAGNSGMLHTGFDAPLSSLEQQCIKSCQMRIFDVIKKFNITYECCGAQLIAWTDKQKEGILALKQNAYAAGVPDVDFITPSQLYLKEPYLHRGAHGALFVPRESVLDSNLLGLCFAHHAKLQGAEILTGCEATEFQEKTLTTSHGQVNASVTINCAGLYGDVVDNLAGISTFRIKPRKGQYCVFAKNASHLLNSIIMPVPTERTKGVALFNSVYDNLLVGPTAEDVPDRSRPPCDPQIHRSLSQRAHWMIPELNSYSPIGQYMGVRPATQFKDYQIQTYPKLGWITVGGIRSTGVSASLGIGQYVAERLVSDMHLEASRGDMKQIMEMSWEVGKDRQSVIIEGVPYHMNHPIFLYGQENLASHI